MQASRRRSGRGRTRRAHRHGGPPRPARAGRSNRRCGHCSRGVGRLRRVQVGPARGRPARLPPTTSSPQTLLRSRSRRPRPHRLRRRRAGVCAARSRRRRPNGAVSQASFTGGRRGVDRRGRARAAQRGPRPALYRAYAAPTAVTCFKQTFGGPVTVEPGRRIGDRFLVSEPPRPDRSRSRSCGPAVGSPRLTFANAVMPPPADAVDDDHEDRRRPRRRRLARRPRPLTCVSQRSIARWRNAPRSGEGEGDVRGGVGGDGVAVEEGAELGFEYADEPSAWVSSSAWSRSATGMNSAMVMSCATASLERHRHHPALDAHLGNPASSTRRPSSRRRR